jgi:GNAT superfamily N-acetyltransferase
LRSATVADAPEVARIYVESWNEGFGDLLGRRSLTNTEISRWSTDLIDGRARWWVAELEGQAAGFAGVCPSRDPVDPELGELDTIAVDPQQWRSGVGRALMTEALRRLREDGYPTAVLWTPAGYGQGHAFYERMGWRATGATRAEGKHVAFEIELSRAGRATASPRRR